MESSRVLPNKCEHCGSTTGVFPEEVYTSYSSNSRDPTETPTRFERIVDRDDPPSYEDDRPLLCRDCAAQHHEYWTGLLDDYYGSVSGPPHAFTNKPIVGFSKCAIPR
jgi:hypothetical protein